jgi:acyl carrier protein
MLLTYPAIAECTAAIKDITVKDKHICAYYVSVAGEALTVSELRQYLTGHLPGYMIPSYFINMKELPLTANGKVDRKALPHPEGFRPQLKQTFVAPGTDLEKLIADAWAEVLPVDIAGIHDNFFDLGGNSMELIMLGRQLKEKINREIPVVTMFTYPTIHSLAVFLSEEGVQGNLSKKKDHQAQKLNKAKDRLKQTVTRMKDSKMTLNKKV